MPPISASAVDTPSASPPMYPLTAAQLDIWLDQLSRGDSPLYNIGGYLELTGPLDPERMQAALEGLVARHDAMRTILLPGAGADGLPLQRFAHALPAPMPIHDVSAHADPEAVARALIQQRIDQPFVLDGEPLFRFLLIRLDEQRHWLSILAHHLIVDGWGFGEMLKSLDEIYNTLAHGQPAPASAPSYIEFIEDNMRYYASPRYAQDRAYWLDKYRQLPEPLLLPRHHAGTATQTQAFAQPLPALLHERMKQVARECGASAFHVLLAALHVYFSRTAQRDEWVVGLPILNRSGARFKSTLGLFAQISPVRMGFGREQTFGELIRAIRDELKKDFRHQRFPLSEMNRALGLLREDRSQLFELTVSYEQGTHDYRYGEALGRINKASNLEEATPLAVHLLSNLTHDDARLYLIYREAYFSADEIQALAERWLLILEQGLEAMNLPVAAFSLSTPAEIARLHQWNATRVNYPSVTTIQQRIEAQAAQHPHAQAAVQQGQCLTYAELNQRANALAHHLLDLGVRPDERVAIVARRGLDTLVGLLAILKAGAAYVPLDPAHPVERLNYLLEDSAPLAVLTQSALRGHLPALHVPVIELDQPTWPVSHIDTPRVPGLTPANLAYVIYTSGSTGLPKGVMVEHRTLCNLVDWHADAFDLHAGSHTSSLAGFGFDAMAWEVWPALCVGATLHLAPASDGSEDIDALLAWWRAQPLDVSFLPTPIAEYAFSRQLDHPTLRTLLIGGDRLRQFPRQQSFAVINNYGPTEATVVATSGRIDAGQALHIGKPVSNAAVYLLDEQQQPLPPGVPGELYVGGAGVARGYLNRADLSAERFLRDPFSSEPGARMYRTGDLARWRADGHLEYLGRNDDQVKIRGVRIEPGEIENALASHAAVREAVVLVRDGQLLAWFTEHTPLDINQLHAHLKTRLTSAMLPSAYVRLPALPLTANGKVDRRALPVPGPDDLIRREYEAPQGEVEVALAQIWAEVLQVERVGRHDHFFELGGHSLLAVILIERMRQLDLSSDVRVLFSQPTLAALAASVGSGREVEVPANRIAADCTHITPAMLPLLQLQQAEIERIVASVPGGAANVQDIYPLAPLQEGILYHHITAAQGDPYLLQSQLAFDSLERVEAFATALRAVMARHDILRTAVLWEGLNTPVQVVWREALLPLQEVELDPAAGPILEQLHARFNARAYRLDVSQAPLMRLVYARDPAQGRVVGILLFHHLAMDHIALEVMRGELQASLSGQVVELAAPVPYRNYVAQARLGVSEQEHEVFFREQLADIDEPTLPFGLQEVQGDGRGIDEAQQTLPTDVYQRLRHQARQAGVSVASLIHLAWARVLAATSGQQRVVFGTVLMGRMQGGEGADRALGVFINTLPLRIDVDAGVLDAVRATHARLTALLGHEHASLALAQRCSGVASPSPLFSALLNYRHSDESELLEPSRQSWQGIETLANEERTNYPLTMSVDDYGNGLRVTGRAVAQIGAQRICGYMQAALSSLVQALEQTPQQPLNRLPILQADELQRLLITYNATDVDCPLEQPLHALFEAQSRRKPDAVALQAGERSLTYRELNERANRLAHHLREHGVQPDARVAICVERGLDLVIGLLGILKAGGAYVPLDPDYPLERLNYMLQDSAPVALLVHGATRHLLGEPGVALIDLDRNSCEQQPASDPQVPGLSASNLAYMIYTSGSTGLPKGVMIEHRSACNMVHWGSEISPPTEHGSLLQKAPFSFDSSVWEIFWPLCSGMRLVLARPDGNRDSAYVVQTIREQQVTVVKFVPALLQQFIEQDGVEQCTSLTDVLNGGGELSAALARQVRARLPWVRLHNVYGPTETTVDSTGWTLEPHMPVPDNVVPIGKALSNTRLYVLDAYDQPVPQGVSGQLHIGGVGVARGYYGLPEMQAERFIDSPFVPGDRLYRTGDLVRYNNDGELEFLGRNDFQIKLRGLRLEPGEIEARLVEHPAIREAVVMVRDERLVGWYTVRSGVDAPSLESLRAHVLERLPEYMVPGAFVQLEALPLTPNDKIDRKALPEPGADAVINRPYVAPQGEIETTLARIWGEVLGVEQVGRHDNFFELGGHSLLAVRLVNLMQRAGLTLSLAELFQHPSVESAAALLSQGAVGGQPDGLVVVRAGRHGTPLFLMHEFSGRDVYFPTLARHIGGEFPIYGLPGVPLGQAQLRTLECMAQRMVGIIRAVQPHGPYRLAGWSFGGVLAHEVAQQLLGLDEPVEFIGMLDSYAPNPLAQDKVMWSGEGLDKRQLLGHCRGRSLMLGAEGEAALVAVQALEAQVEQLAFPELFQRCQAQQLTDPELATVSAADAWHYFDREAAHRLALAHYRVSPASQTIHLFRAQELMDGQSMPSPTRGWEGRFDSGLLRCIDIPGDHRTMMKAPHIQALGQALTQALDAVVAPTAAPYQPLLTIQTGHAGHAPIFCVPGAGDSVTGFIHLTEAIGPEWPIIGLQPRGLDGVSVPHSAVEAAATCYLQAIEQIYPQGPVHLIGHSFGGWVAHAMAAQLQAAGREVASLTLIDSEAPGGDGTAGKPYTATAALQRLIDTLQLSCGKSLGIDPAAFANADDRTQLRLLHDGMVRAGVLSQRAAPEAMHGPVRTFATALRTVYQPRLAYTGPVRLVLVDDPTLDEWGNQREQAAMLEGWQRQVNDLAVWYGPGNHFTILKAPNVFSFAAWWHDGLSLAVDQVLS